MSTHPESMRAFVIGGRSFYWPLQAALTKYENQPKLVNKPVPKPASQQLLVKIEVYAANPTDTLHLDYIGPAGSIIGCDLVGSVVAVGTEVTRHKVGDRIIATIHGGKYPDIGSAAEYCTVDDDLAWKVPQGLSSEDAATFGVGFLTAAGVVYDVQHIPQPPEKVSESPWYFVSGGATAVGMFAIQLAHHAGYKVIASASPKSFDLVKSYGADHVVSYADHPAALKEIHEVTGGGVKMGLDCVGGKQNLRFAVDAFASGGGELASILPGGKSPRADVKLKEFLLYRYLGKAFTFIPMIMKFPAEPEKRVFLASFIARAGEVVETYKIKPNPVEVGHGLETIPEGWKRLRDKKVSGKKLVYAL